MSVSFWLAECSPLADPALFEKAYGLMSWERQIKIAQMRFDKDKRLSLGAGLLLHHALERCGISEMPPVSVGEKGKPFFQDHPDVHFNLSHSGSMVCCAVGTMPLGCDIEQHDPRHIKIAKRFFTKAEQAWLAEGKETEEKTKRFFRLWTLKESFIKATGYGLTYGLDHFSVVFKDDLPFLQQEECEDGSQFPPIDLSAYLLCEPEAPESYGCALCLKSAPDGEIIRPQWVDLTTIL